IIIEICERYGGEKSKMEDGKMKGLKKRICTLMTAVVMSMSLVTPVHAATTYTPVAGTSCNFNKYLIMDAGDNVPNATFGFTVASGDAINATDTTMEVLSGIMVTEGGKTYPSITDVTFTPGDPTATSAGTNVDVARAASDRKAGLTAATGVQLETGEKYATQNATVDFSKISFSEPGIYRYIITESTSETNAAAGIMHDNDVDRVLDVYVTDDGTGKLTVSGYVMHKDAGVVTAGADKGSGDAAQDGTALADKTDGFTNEYSSKDLKIEKEVTGNQASRDKYFEFTVTCTEVADTAKFSVSLADDNDDNTNDGNADATSGAAKNGGTIAENAGKNNLTEVTGAQLKAGQKFYLQHGQSIVIRGLAPNVSYEVTENAEDYKSAAKADCTNSGVIGTVAGDNKMATAGFTNTRNGIIPTGILLSATGLIVLGLIVVAGIVFFAIRSRKKYDEE
nr:hypothetical protein [Eubacterium sp.]